MDDRATQHYQSLLKFDRSKLAISKEVPKLTPLKSVNRQQAEMALMVSIMSTMPEDKLMNALNSVIADRLANGTMDKAKMEMWSNNMSCFLQFHSGPK